MTFLIWLTALSLISVAVVILTRVYAIRSGKVFAVGHTSLQSLVQSRIDYVAYAFVVLCKEAAKLVSLYILLGVRRVLSLIKIGVIRIEKKFSKVTDLIHGKGVISKKGSVSMFLLKIAERERED